MHRADLVMVSLLVGATALAGCGPARRSDPLAVEPLALDARLQRGQKAFMRYCHSCHPHGAAGLGPAINDKPLTDGMVALQVRRGFGAMPAFPKKAISEDDLEALIDYLDVLADRDMRDDAVSMTWPTGHTATLRRWVGSRPPASDLVDSAPVSSHTSPP